MKTTWTPTGLVALALALAAASCGGDTQVTRYTDVELRLPPPPGGLEPGARGDQGPSPADDADSQCEEGAAERCNGLDDDCDGATDEGFVLACEPCAQADCISATITGSGWHDGVRRNALIGSDKGLHLPLLPAPQPHIFVANSAEDTVVKLRVDDGSQVARIYVGNDPSRTAVDGEGDAWVGMRGAEPGCEELRCSKVVKIDGDCTPSVGPDVITTECILLDLHGVGAKIRGVAVDAQGHAWVGTTDEGDVIQLHGQTGEVLQRAQLLPRCPVYGLALDEGGYLWASCVDRFAPFQNEAVTVRFDPVLGKSDLSIPLAGSEFGEPYGIAADGEGGIWLATFDTAVFRVDNRTAEIGPSVSVGGTTRGLALDDDGMLWVADSSGDQLHRIDREQAEVVLSVDVGWGPVGVAVDHLGKVWAVNSNSEDATRLSLDGKVADTFPLGKVPYTYSDMTGAAFRVLRTLRGSFERTYTVGFQAQWTGLAFEGAAPEGTTVTFQIRAAGSDAWQPVALDGTTGTITPPITASAVDVRVELVTTDRSAIPNVLSLTFTLEATP